MTAANTEAQYESIKKITAELEALKKNQNSSSWGNGGGNNWKKNGGNSWAPQQKKQLSDREKDEHIGKRHVSDFVEGGSNGGDTSASVICKAYNDKGCMFHFKQQKCCGFRHVPAKTDEKERSDEPATKKAKTSEE